MFSRDQFVPEKSQEAIFLIIFNLRKVESFLEIFHILTTIFQQNLSGDKIDKTFFSIKIPQSFMSVFI